MSTEQTPAAAQPPLQLDPNLIAAIVLAVKQGMAGDTSTQVDYSAMSQVIGDAVAAGISKNTRRRVSIGEYVEKKMRNRSILNRKTFDNDVWCNPEQLTNEEIDLFNKITHSGRYVDRKVECIVGTDGAEEVIYLRYHNATADLRSDLANSIPVKKGSTSLACMLRQIVEAQVEERAEREHMDQEVRERKNRFKKSTEYGGVRA